MLLKKQSIDKLCNIIAVEKDDYDERFYYRSMKDLISLFNNHFGYKDATECAYIEIENKQMYRSEYTKKRVNELNGSLKLNKLVELLVDETEYSSKKNETVDNNFIAEEINKILKYDNYILRKNELGVYKVEYVRTDFDGETDISAHFENIEQILIDAIANAKYSIWICSPWFTNKRIYSALKKKLKERLEIRVIISDEERNTLDFSIFDTYKVKRYGSNEQNLVHEKFLIIDFETVFNGSYNLTYAAGYNKENMVKFSKKENTKDFLDEFMKLINLKDSIPLK